METEEYALVRCSRCGEYSRVAWELLGETKPEDVEGYLCGACEYEIDMAWSALQDRHLLEDGDDDISEVGWSNCSCPYCVCPVLTEFGEVCSDCLQGAHQG